MNNIRRDDRCIEKGNRCILNHSRLPESNVIVIESDNIRGAHAKDEKNRAQEIVNLHQEILIHLRLSLGKAIKIGKILIEQKSNLSHGEFTPWVKANIPFSDRTARNYMRLFRESHNLKMANISNLSQAYRFLKRLNWSQQKETENKREMEKRTFITLSLDVHQKEIIMTAMDRIKKLLMIDSNSTALEFIAYHWFCTLSLTDRPDLMPIEAAKRLFETILCILKLPNGYSKRPIVLKSI